MAVDLQRQAQQNLDLDNEGLEFDPLQFSRGLMSMLSGFRSKIGSVPSDIIVSPSTQGIARDAETRVNVFFRLIGLPAIRDEMLLNNRTNKSEQLETILADQQRKRRSLSQDYTLNYFSASGSGLTTSLEKLSLRNSTLIRGPKDAETFNKLLSDPLDFDESVKDQPQRRPSIFPLLVDASVPIYPLSRRIAPLFYDGDYILLGGKLPLKRPFLQHVVYMRTKVFSGFDAGILSDVRTNIQNEVGEGVFDDQQLQNFTFLELKIIQKFIETLRQTTKQYINARNNLKRLRKRIQFYSAIGNTPEERKGKIAGADPTVDFTTDLDFQLKVVRTELSKIDLFLTSLPTEDINRADRMRRLEEQSNVRNFNSGALIPEFIELTTYDRDDWRRKEARILRERKRVVQQFEQAREAMEYYTGEFTGLSIFDVICILYALFTVDLNSLVGLMNENAKRRLLLDPFYSTSNQATTTNSFSTNILDIANNPTSLAVSLSNLETKVREAFDIARAFSQRKSQTNQAPPEPAGT